MITSEKDYFFDDSANTNIYLYDLLVDFSHAFSLIHPLLYLSKHALYGSAWSLSQGIHLDKWTENNLSIWWWLNWKFGKIIDI